MKVGGENNDWWVHTAVISCNEEGDEKIENETSLFWRGSLSALMKRLKILGGRKLSNVERCHLKAHRQFIWVDPTNGNRMEMRLLDKAPTLTRPPVSVPAQEAAQP